MNAITKFRHWLKVRRAVAEWRRLRLATQAAEDGFAAARADKAAKGTGQTMVKRVGGMTMFYGLN